MCSEVFNVVIFRITKMEHHETINLSFLHLKNQILYIENIMLYIVLYMLYRALDMLWPIYGIWGQIPYMGHSHGVATRT
jgi:hypothetical protein